jgi:Spy/CpxP family protein refolding chaperone
MKSVIYAVAVSMVLTGIAMAQPPGRAEHMDRMAILLDLDEYQKTEVRRIMQEQRQTARATREAMRDSGERPSREERVALREQMRDATMTQLQAVLRPEQITKFEVLREMATERGRGRRGRHGEGRDED